jgi:hypothetical protein
MSALSTPQRLVLVKFFTDGLAKLREDELLPSASGEMPAGSRMPVMFGGRLAGWATMPKPSKRAAFVSDEKKLLAWAEKQYPEKVATVETVDITDDVLALVAEHLPEAIIKARRVDPQWLSDVQGALKDHGHYITAKGEKLTEVPGITLPEPNPPSPRVNLEDDAQAVISAAWLAGEIPAAEFLALPAAESEAAA